ncbi:hypothetical protein ACFE04_018747 [Oxalis oulophora]
MEQMQPCCTGAEAVINLQPGSSLPISYHPLFGPHDDLLLLELDENLLPEVLNQRVTIRGHPDENAVLCTQSKTFAIKFVGTSNSVFLVPPSDCSAFFDNSQNSREKNNDQKSTASVIKVAGGALELIVVSPNIDKLKSLLRENPFNTEDVVEMEEIGIRKTGLYTWDDLLDKVQASEDELMAGLQTLSAVEIGGFWRTVDENYMGMILKMLLHNVVLNDWSFCSLDGDEVVKVLESDGFSTILARHCLSMFGSIMDGSRNLWKLDERQVCVHFVREILRKGKWKIQNFMAEWKQKIPEGMKPDFAMLDNEVLTEKIGVDIWVRAFSISHLPSTPADRFSVLFKERAKWEWKDLQPYIRDLNVPGLSAESLLLKYTRRTQPNADTEPIFTSR